MGSHEIHYISSIHAFSMIMIKTGRVVNRLAVKALIPRWDRIPPLPPSRVQIVSAAPLGLLVLSGTAGIRLLLFRKYVSIAMSRSLYGISNFFVQLVRKVVSHAVNQHELGVRDGRSCVLATRWDKQGIVHPMNDKFRCFMLASRWRRRKIATLVSRFFQRAWP